MERFIKFIREHLNRQEEALFDDTARLRTNLLLFTFTISILFLVMTVRAWVSAYQEGGLGTLSFGGVTFLFFVWQFFRKDYSQLIAWLFGALSLLMAVYFISFQDGTGHLWIFILPIVGTQMAPTSSTLVYNGILLTLLLCLLNTPLYQLLDLNYSGQFCAIFPVSVLIVMLCNYVAAYSRLRTHKQLLITSKELHDLAFYDPLTGAYNRRALAAHFGSLEKTAEGYSFAILDLDYFKKINDTYGHETGDKFLSHFVTLVKRCISADSYLYRWGGEEFLLVQKSNDKEELTQRLNAICTLVAKTPLVLHPVQEGDLPIVVAATVSIGVMCADASRSITECVAIADEQAYRAKQTGRNRVV